MGIETEKRDKQTTIFNYIKMLFLCVVFRKMVDAKRKKIVVKMFALVCCQFLISSTGAFATGQPNNNEAK